MSIPRLEDVDMSACMSILGDTIAYTPVSGDVVTSGYVNYRDVLRDIETGTVIEQAITVQIQTADAPTRPSQGCRITLGKLPGMIFKPVNVRPNESRDHWEFEVVKVNV